MNKDNMKIRYSGLIIILFIVLFYLALYILNFIIPLNIGSIHHYSNYTSRMWSWTEQILGISAFIILVIKWREVETKSIIISIALSLLSSISIYARNGSISNALEEGIIIIITLLAGIILFKKSNDMKILVFEGSLKEIVVSILLGTAFSIPLCILNNIYFYFSLGASNFNNIFNSAFLAFNPGISEEIIFRFFIIGGCITILKDIDNKRLVRFISIMLGVIPHSLNHLPDLFIVNPPSAIFLLIATSILFGLPMAYLQLKKNLESAISFHWFIDFIRFLWGY